jgi:predicted phosphate transport protein (TIGR00153 family)
VRFSLKPQDDAFYAFFNDAADNIRRGVGILSELGDDQPDFQKISERLVDVEHDNDQLTHRLFNKVNSTFVTPMDRTDMYHLAGKLDDILDHIEAAANLVYLYGLSDLPALPREMIEQITVLGQQAELLVEFMPKLKGLNSSMQEFWVECNRLENDGDRAYRMLLVRLYSGEYEALTVMKLKEVGDELEAACDSFESVSNVVESVYVKES